MYRNDFDVVVMPIHVADHSCYRSTEVVWVDFGVSVANAAVYSIGALTACVHS